MLHDHNEPLKILNHEFHFNMFLVDKETQNKRLKICGKCKHRSKKFFGLFNSDSCSLCKCLLKAKTSVTKEFDGKCPVGKW